MTETRDLPLAVDLDGTLIHGDVFVLSLIEVLRTQPWRVPLLVVGWLRNGRAHLKAQVAAQAPTPETLRYDQRVVDWLRAERARGRTIVLASASDRQIVERVAAHVGVFDRVIASDGRINLKSRRKAEALRAAFPQGFVYAGNESADLKVWEAAAGAVLVNCDAALEREAKERFTIECCFERPR